MQLNSWPYPHQSSGRFSLIARGMLQYVGIYTGTEVGQGAVFDMPNPLIVVAWPYPPSSSGRFSLIARGILQYVGIYIRVSHFSLFFKLSLVLLTTKALGLYEFTKKIQRYRPKIEVWGKIFVFDPIYKGKRAKISPKIHKIEIWPKLRPKVIYSPNQSHRDHIWGMFEL